VCLPRNPPHFARSVRFTRSATAKEWMVDRRPAEPRQGMSGARFTRPLTSYQMNPARRQSELFGVLIAFFQRTTESTFYGEFDPGSGRTLAACLIHASRATKPGLVRVLAESGERVSNTWVMCPGLWDSHGKPWLIPDNPYTPHGVMGKAPAVWDQPAVYQLVGGVTAYQGDDA
jgi:hypothetical protein